MIEWRESVYANDHEITLIGKVNSEDKYFIGNEYLEDEDAIVVDVNIRGKGWLEVDAVVGSAEEGKQLCEMWEATGAYD